MPQLLRARPVTPPVPPTLVRLSQWWTPRDPIPARAGRCWPDPTGDTATARATPRRGAWPHMIAKPGRH